MSIDTCDGEADSLSPAHVHLTIRAANEGIPIAAIARILQQPFGIVADALHSAAVTGSISNVPKADWPLSTSWQERLPSVPRAVNPEDVEFSCRQLFRLTSLEAGFLMVLLRSMCADKEKLHCVIEGQRAMRQFRPDKQETTDPKMVDVMICKLRKKLRDVDPTLVILTSWGRGYFIEQPVKDAILKAAGVANAFGPDYQRGDVAGASA